MSARVILTLCITLCSLYLGKEEVDLVGTGGVPQSKVAKAVGATGDPAAAAVGLC